MTDTLNAEQRVMEARAEQRARETRADEAALTRLRPLVTEAAADLIHGVPTRLMTVRNLATLAIWNVMADGCSDNCVWGTIGCSCQKAARRYADAALAALDLGPRAFQDSA